MLIQGKGLLWVVGACIQGPLLPPRNSSWMISILIVDIALKKLAPTNYRLLLGGGGTNFIT